MGLKWSVDFTKHLPGLVGSLDDFPIASLEREVFGVTNRGGGLVDWRPSMMSFVSIFVGLSACLKSSPLPVYYMLTVLHPAQSGVRSHLIVPATYMDESFGCLVRHPSVFKRYCDMRDGEIRIEGQRE